MQVHALSEAGSSSPHLDSKLPAEDTVDSASSASSSNIVAVPRDEADDVASQKKKAAKDAKKKGLKRL